MSASGTGTSVAGVQQLHSTSSAVALSQYRILVDTTSISGYGQQLGTYRLLSEEPGSSPVTNKWCEMEWGTLYGDGKIGACLIYLINDTATKTWRLEVNWKYAGLPYYWEMDY